MINASDRAKYPLHVKAAPKLTMIDRADACVDIRDILKSMNVWTPSGMFYSYKISCPWDYEHADGGRDKNCRLFGKTNLHCWALHGFVTPTMLYSRWKSVSRKAAAEILLEERSLLRKPWRETWNDILNERETAGLGRLGSKHDVVAALHSTLDSDALYTNQEFSLSVRTKWLKVLIALDQVWELPGMDFEKLNVFFEASVRSLKTAAKEASNASI